MCTIRAHHRNCRGQSKASSGPRSRTGSRVGYSRRQPKFLHKCSDLHCRDCIFHGRCNCADRAVPLREDAPAAAERVLQDRTSRQALQSPRHLPLRRHPLGQREPRIRFVAHSTGYRREIAAALRTRGSSGSLHLRFLLEAPFRTVSSAADLLLGEGRLGGRRSRLAHRARPSPPVRLALQALRMQRPGPLGWEEIPQGTRPVLRACPARLALRAC